MIERPRGTRDLGPQEMKQRNELEKKFRSVCDSFNYDEICTPTFEHTDLFLKRSGPSIVEEIYDFEDKGGRSIALRPEYTASVMRMYSESLRELPKPLKVYYFGSVFRYERPQSGRYREFWHFGTELIGPDTPRADAENIALACRCLDRAGLENYDLKISNLQILEQFLDEKGVSEDKREEIYHKVDKEEEVEIIKPLIGKSLDQIEEELTDPSPVEYTKKVFDALEYYGIEREDYSFDLRIVRGLDYYQGIVFEIESKRLDAQKQICGGGDYNLGEIFDIDISSKGFAFGFDRVMLALKEENNEPKPSKPTCYIIPIGEEALSYAYGVLDELREADIGTDIELMGRNIGKALGYGDKKDFRFSLLIGEDELEKEEVSLKNMETGEQRSVKRERLIEEIEG